MPSPVPGLSLEAISIWIAALLTLAIYSFLYKDNPIYKFAEHLFVGVSAGYVVGITYHLVFLALIYRPLFTPAAVKLVQPNYLVIFPALLGALMYFRFSRRWGWLARWPICFVMGFGAGVGIPLMITNFLVQAHSTIQPLAPLSDKTHQIQWFLGFSNLVLLAGVVCVLCYFYFSKPHKGALGVASRLGIWLLMIAFGAGFGNTVMARISLLIGRVQFLIDKWWPLLRHPF